MPAAKRSSLALLFVGLYLWWPGGLDAPHPRTQHVCVYKDPSANMHLVQQVPLRSSCTYVYIIMG